jgi:hypothetical protein
MPNLTSYLAPVIHLNRELPKTYCDLIKHEFDYIHFLRTRIAKIQSSLAFINKKNRSSYTNNIQRHQYFDDKQHLFDDIYQRNLELCKKILQIWNGKRKIGVDCHNENYEKQRNITHFRLRQQQWKDKIESENKQFIHSLM